MNKLILNTRIAMAAVLMLLGISGMEGQVIASISSNIPVTCFGACNGSLTVSATGGAGGYTFSWAPGGMTTATITGLCPGTYTATVTDAMAGTATVSATVVQPTAVNVSSGSVFVCYGASTSICPTITGGTPGYSFMWSPAASLSSSTLNCPVASPTVTTTYTLTATDANGCLATGTSTVTVDPLFNVIISGTGGIVCDGSNINLCVSTNPPVGINFNWSGSCGFSSPSPCPSAIPVSMACNPMTFSVTAINANGCIATATTSVMVSPNPTPFVTSIIEPGCGTANGSLTVSASGGTAPYVYSGSSPGPGLVSWGPTPNPLVYGLATVGSSTVCATDANGCMSCVSNIISLDSCEVVWPGDADNDLSANNNDILDIGLYYGNATNARPTQGNLWFGYPSQNAALTKPNGYNVKHDDCNGDGMVDAADTTAVILNYNLNHPPYKLAQTAMSGPPLSLQFLVDSIGNNTKAIMYINLGTAANPVNNVYGLAFSISIDTTIVAKDSSQLSVSGSWLGAGSPVFLNNRIENYNNSEIDIALCRTDHNNVSGYGAVAELDMIMKDDISGKFMSTFEKILHSTIVRYKLISANGDTVSVTTSGDSIKVSMVTTDLVGQNTSNLIAGVYPNPVQDELKVVSANADLKKAEVYAYNGQLSLSVESLAAVKEMSLNMSALSNGIYMVKLYGESGIKVIRVQKQ